MSSLTFHTADIITQIRSEKRYHSNFTEMRREQYYQRPNLLVVLTSALIPDALHLISDL